VLVSRPAASSSRLSSRPLDYLVSLLNVSRAVSTDASITELGQVIVDSCRDSFDCDEVSLMMVDPSGGELVVTAFAGHRDVGKIRNAKVKVGEGVAGTVARTRRPIILGPKVDTGQFPGFQTKTRHIQFSMIAPIIVRDKLAGVLNVSASSAEVVFTEDDLRVLCILAEHAGIVAAKSRDTERISRLIRRIRQRHRRRIQELQARLDARENADADDTRAAA
jgi:GAF domain-containing protein